MIQKSTRGVQQHEVNAAADALIAKGVRPTIERVRGEMGRGSPNTVAPMLDAWFAGLAGRLGLAADTEAGGPPLEVRQFLGQLWSAALDAGEMRASSALSQQHAQIQVDQDALAAARSELVARDEALKEKAAGIDHALALAQRQLDERATEMASLRADLGTAQGDVVKARASLAGVVQERDADRQSFAELQRSHAAERQRNEDRSASTERRLMEDVDRSRQETKAAKIALSQQQRQHEVLKEKHEALVAIRHQDQVESAALTERLALANQRHAELLSEIKQLKASTPALPRRPAAAKKPPSGTARRGAKSAR